MFEKHIYTSFTVKYLKNVLRHYLIHGYLQFQKHPCFEKETFLNIYYPRDITGDYARDISYDFSDFKKQV